MNFTTADWIIAGIILLFGIWGAIKGLIEEVARKFGYFAGLLVALMFTMPLEKVFIDQFDLPRWLAAASSYILLFIAGYIFIKIIGGILHGVFETANLTAVDNFLGLILGLFEGVVLIGLIQLLLKHQTVFDVQQYFDNSVICSQIIEPVFDWVTTVFHKVF